MLTNSRMGILLLAAGCAAILFAQQQQPQQQQQRPPSNGSLEVREMFRGTVELTQPQRRTLPVVVQAWTLREKQRVERVALPAAGTVVQLRAGAVTTSIAGQRQERKAGEFWTLPPGTAMALESGNDTASLQAVVVGE